MTEEEYLGECGNCEKEANDKCVMCGIPVCENHHPYCASCN